MKIQTCNIEIFLDAICALKKKKEKVECPVGFTGDFFFILFCIVSPSACK